MGRTRLFPALLMTVLPTPTLAAGCLYTSDHATLTIVGDHHGAAVGFVISNEGQHGLQCMLKRPQGDPNAGETGWPTPVEGVCDLGPNTSVVLRGEFSVILPAPDLPPPTALYFAGRTFYPSPDCNETIVVSRQLPVDAAPIAPGGSLTNHTVHTVTVRPDGMIVTN